MILPYKKTECNEGLFWTGCQNGFFFGFFRAKKWLTRLNMDEMALKADRENMKEVAKLAL